MTDKTELERLQKNVEERRDAYHSARNLYEDTQTAYVIALDERKDYLKEQDNA